MCQYGSSGDDISKAVIQLRGAHHDLPSGAAASAPALLASARAAAVRAPRLPGQGNS